MIFRKYSRLILFLFIFLVIGILISMNINLVKYLIQENILNYGYIAVLVFGFLADFITQPIGPEAPGIIALIFGMDFYPVLLFVLIGSYIGSIVSFYVGKFFLYSDVDKICRKKSRKKHCDFFKKYGKFALLIGAITPVPYVLFCWLAGAFKMKLFDFILFGLIPRTFRIFAVMFVVGLFF